MTDLVHSGSASIPGGDEAAGASMLQKAARAAYEEFSAMQAYDGGRVDWDDIARAVLMAVREPGEAAVMAGSREIEDAEMGPEPWTGPYDIWKPAARTSFTAMIDAILADGEGR